LGSLFFSENLFFFFLQRGNTQEGFLSGCLPIYSVYSPSVMLIPPPTGDTSFFPSSSGKGRRPSFSPMPEGFLVFPPPPVSGNVIYSLKAVPFWLTQLVFFPPPPCLVGTLSPPPSLFPKNLLFPSRYGQKKTPFLWEQFLLGTLFLGVFFPPHPCTVLRFGAGNPKGFP